MVARAIIGKHPAFGTYGVWLSRPGVDVEVPGPAANFLLRPDVKAEQIVLSGFAYVYAGAAQILIGAYPVTLAKQPYLQINANINPNQEYPHALGLALPGGGAVANEIVIGLQIRKDGIYATNNSVNDLWVSYIIYNRGIGF